MLKVENGPSGSLFFPPRLDLMALKRTKKRSGQPLSLVLSKSVSARRGLAASEADGLPELRQKQRRSSRNDRKASRIKAGRNKAPTHPLCEELRLDVTKVYSKRRVVREKTSKAFISDMVGKAWPF